MSRGDVYQLSFEEICETCKHISRGRARVSKSASRSVSQAKLGNLFDHFKTSILSNLTKQVEMLIMKYEEKEDADFFVHVETMLLNIAPHYQGGRNCTKRTMEQVDFQCNYLM